LKTYSVLIQRDGVLYKYTQLSDEENADGLKLNDEESKKWWKRPWAEADSDTVDAQNAVESADIESSDAAESSDTENTADSSGAEFVEAVENSDGVECLFVRGEH